MGYTRENWVACPFKWLYSIAPPHFRLCGNDERRMPTNLETLSKFDIDPAGCAGLGRMPKMETIRDRSRAHASQIPNVVIPNALPRHSEHPAPSLRTPCLVTPNAPPRHSERSEESEIVACKPVYDFRFLASLEMTGERRNDRKRRNNEDKLHL